jgi:hypothetical protein
MNRPLRMLVDLAHPVHLVRKLPARRHVCEHYIAVIGKNGLRELVPFTRIPRNMEFHHKKPTPETRST